MSRNSLVFCKFRYDLKWLKLYAFVGRIDLRVQNCCRNLTFKYVFNVYIQVTMNNELHMVVFVYSGRN